MAIGDILNGGIKGVIDQAATSAATGLARSVLPQTSVMMALGLFVFGLHTVPYQQLQRKRTWRHPSTSRVGRRPARQFTGPGDDAVTLSGVLYPELTGGRVSLNLLTAMADTGKAWPLIQGDGTFFGHFIIESSDETSSYFFTDGTARKIEFSLSLTRVDDDAKDMLGSFSKELMALI